MKKVCNLLTIVLGVMLVVVGCTPKDEIQDPETLLEGYWQRANSNEYARFMRDDSETKDGYFLGYEWDEDDEVYEDDLWNISYHGVGWFEWFVTKEDKENKLTQIHLMDNGGADIPKVYTIVTLTETTLSLTDGFKQRDYIKTSKK
ncbi:MAG: hypothetical protein MJZ59_05295 [Paludibacteraceae bacterium]|nr:hypothetical protein [Paludibacteraceae bacterium]